MMMMLMLMLMLIVRVWCLINAVELQSATSALLVL